MRRLIGALLAIVLATAGCTGVPRSSEPQVISSVGGARAAAQEPVASPSPGADRRTIVAGFLSANARFDAHHAAARAFLTPEAKNRWSDTTVTIIDSPQIGNPSAENQVTVKGRVIGTIDASGVYTPKLQGDGLGGGEAAVPFTFGLARVKGQWRIDQLQNGLLIDYQQFQTFYQRQWAVYFYDLAERHLVPDPRYTSLRDSTLLSNWLVTQLAKQPRPQLQGAVSTELPAQTKPKVTIGTTVSVEIPGASQLDATTRDRLAGQIALTLEQVNANAVYSITDSGRPVRIPAAGGTQFSADEFEHLLGAERSGSKPPQLYYIRTGKVLNSRGKPVPGPLGTGRYGLDSVALADLSGSGNLAVAGVNGSPGHRRLLVGTEHGGLHRSGLVGTQLSRPAWAPDRNEVWVGDGPKIYRVVRGGRPSVVPVTAGSGKVAGNITALRFSPEGSRIAVVLTGPKDTSQLWIGAVVRNGRQVRVDNLHPISPSDVQVTDVAWNDQLKLFAIGKDTTTGLGGVFEVQCDGSLWSPKGLANLPDTPDSITVAKDQVAAVSAGTTVWVQRADRWVGLTGQTPTYGTKPIYVQ